MYPKVSFPHPIFSVKKPSGISEKLSCFSASYQLLLVLLNGHLVFSEDWKQARGTMGHGRLSHLALLCIDHAEFFHLFSIRVLDQKTLVIYFESCGREP